MDGEVSDLNRKAWGGEGMKLVLIREQGCWKVADLRVIAYWNIAQQVLKFCNVNRANMSVYVIAGHEAYAMLS